MAQTPQKAKTSPGQVKSNGHGRMPSRKQLCARGSARWLMLGSPAAGCHIL